MDEETRTKANARLKRIAGQVTGIQRMVEDDRYCVDVLLQVAAVQAALMETGRVILSGHFETCLTQAMRSRDEQERRKKIDELIDLFSRFCRIEGVPSEGAEVEPSDKRGRGR
jgi:CsoR family transcriptional regulator, copper-sensing transcriptional repressor